jgi:hypothetical protein
MLDPAAAVGSALSLAAKPASFARIRAATRGERAAHRLL